MEKIHCTCDTERRLERVAPGELKPYQRELKTLTEQRYAQLKTSIQQYGFTAPLLVWKTPNGEMLVIDGHQRLRVLDAEGWEVEGGIPIVTVKADSEREAAEKLLVVASQYGGIEQEGLYEFVSHYQIDAKEFDLAALPEVDWVKFTSEFYDSEPFLGDETPEATESQPDVVSEIHIPAAVWLRQSDEIITAIDAVISEYGGRVEWAAQSAQLRSPEN